MADLPFPIVDDLIDGAIPVKHVSPVFKKIFVASHLSEEISEMLQLWYPSYIREIEAQQGLKVGNLKAPQRFTKRNSFDGVPGEDLPKCVVVVPGMIGTPVKRNSQYEATWRVGVGCVVTGKGEDDAILHADILGAATRDIMLKRAGDYGDGTELLDEAYDDRPIPNATQFYRIAAVWFSVRINNVATARGGPTSPDAEPYQLGLVETVNIDLTKEPLV